MKVRNRFLSLVDDFCEVLYRFNLIVFILTFEGCEAHKHKHMHTDKYVHEKMFNSAKCRSNRSN